MFLRWLRARSPTPQDPVSPVRRKADGDQSPPPFSLVETPTPAVLAPQSSFPRPRLWVTMLWQLHSARSRSLRSTKGGPSAPTALPRNPFLLSLCRGGRGCQAYLNQRERGKEPMARVVAQRPATTLGRSKDRRALRCDGGEPGEVCLCPGGGRLYRRRGAASKPRPSPASAPRTQRGHTPFPLPPPLEPVWAGAVRAAPGPREPSPVAQASVGARLEGPRG